MSAHPYDQTHPYWCGVLSMQIALQLRDVKEPARGHLKGALEGYLRSGVPAPEVAKTLREEMKK